MGELYRLILDHLYRLWPLRVIDVNQQGIRYHSDGTVRLLASGKHFFLPGMQRIEKMNVAYQQQECGVQNMETKDGVGVSFSFNVGYTIADASKLITEYYNFDHTLQLIVRGKLGMIVSEATYSDLQHKLPEIAQEMLAALRKEFSGSGVRIKDVRPDEFGKSRLYRFIGAQPFYE